MTVVELTDITLTDITDTDMQTGMKGTKKGRGPGIDEIRVEMVLRSRESGISWTKRHVCGNVKYQRNGGQG